MGSKAERSAGAPPRQKEAILPRLLTEINLLRTKQLIPELADPPSIKIEQAINLFEELVSYEKDEKMKASRQWSREYFQACAEGSKARRDFLIEEGVLYGRDGEYLYCPPRVQPQMEIANFKPSDCPEHLQNDVEEMMKLMYAEYFGVKNLLSFPDRADIIASLSNWISPLNRIRLAEPKLKLSLLLKDYVKGTLEEAKKTSGSPLVAILGPGKGEELVPLTREGYSVLCLDAHDETTLRYLFQTTFEQARVEKPRIETIGQGTNIDTAPFEAWREKNCPATIFICSEIDFGEKGVIPEELSKISRVAASIYVLHEMPLGQRASLIDNMAFVSKDSVVIFDGNPSIEAFDNIILPVSERGQTPITGHDAVITHLLCLPPEKMKTLVNEAASGLNWKVETVGPPIPKPFFHKLQVAAIGRLS